MRIGVLAPPWLPVPPPAYGGTEAVIDLLVRGFARSGHDVVLFTTGDSTCPVRRRWFHDRADAGAMGTTAREAAHALAGYDAFRDCDIVHDHTVVGPLLSCAHQDMPVVTTFHGQFAGDLETIGAAIHDKVAIVAISGAQRRDAPDVRVERVIHHGIDPAGFPAGGGRGGYLLFLGRMAPEKGAHAAIRVARRARTPLLIAAKMSLPGERRYFAEHVEEHLGPDVVYVGEVCREERLALLADAAALVNPIRWCEPFGLVMVEALACGTPVLAFREGAAPEIVRHTQTGFLCEDEDDMTSAIARLGEIDRSACRRSAIEDFSAHRMVNEYVELFTTILADRASATHRWDVELSQRDVASQGCDQPERLPA